MPSTRRLGRGDESNILRSICAALDLQPQSLSHGLLHGRFEAISLGAFNDDSLDLNDHIAWRETGFGGGRSRKDLLDLNGAQFRIEDSVGIDCQGKAKPALFSRARSQGREKKRGSKEQNESRSPIHDNAADDALINA
jgi:hypothetical protein